VGRVINNQEDRIQCLESEIAQLKQMEADISMLKAELGMDKLTSK